MTWTVKCKNYARIELQTTPTAYNVYHLSRLGSINFVAHEWCIDWTAYNVSINNLGNSDGTSVINGNRLLFFFIILFCVWFRDFYWEKNMWRTGTASDCNVMWRLTQQFVLWKRGYEYIILFRVGFEHRTIAITVAKNGIANLYSSII